MRDSSRLTAGLSVLDGTEIHDPGWLVGFDLFSRKLRCITWSHAWVGQFSVRLSLTSHLSGMASWACSDMLRFICWNPMHGWPVHAMRYWYWSCLTSMWRLRIVTDFATLLFAFFWLHPLRFPWAWPAWCFLPGRCSPGLIGVDIWFRLDVCHLGGSMTFGPVATFTGVSSWRGRWKIMWGWFIWQFPCLHMFLRLSSCLWGTESQAILSLLSVLLHLEGEPWRVCLWSLDLGASSSVLLTKFF